jgi:hypothetical protein
MIRTGQVVDLAEVARMCGASRARFTAVSGLLGITTPRQESWLLLAE